LFVGYFTFVFSPDRRSKAVSRVTFSKISRRQRQKVDRPVRRLDYGTTCIPRVHLDRLKTPFPRHLGSEFAVCIECDFILCTILFEMRGTTSEYPSLHTSCAREDTRRTQDIDHFDNANSTAISHHSEPPREPPLSSSSGGCDPEVDAGNNETSLLPDVAMIGTACDDDDDDDDEHISYCEELTPIGALHSELCLPNQTTLFDVNDAEVDVSFRNITWDEPPPLPRHYAMWQSQATEEATVLDTQPEATYAKLPSARSNRRQHQMEEDARLAASLREDEELLLAMKLSAYQGGGGSRCYSNLSSQRRSSGITSDSYAVHLGDAVEPQAAIVEISHRSTGGATAHAEWIGPSSASAIPMVNGSNSSVAAAAATCLDEDDDACEATVIDSAPMEKQDDSMDYLSGEAQILVDNSDDSNAYLPDDDRKPAAVRYGARSARENGNLRNPQPSPYVLTHVNHQSTSVEHRHSCSLPSLFEQNVGEVVSIQDERDLHPELRTHDDALDSQAELVGLDHLVTGVAAVATFSTGNTQVAEVVAIQEDRYVHRADPDFNTETSAELVGNLLYVNTGTLTSEESVHHGVVATMVTTEVLPSDDWAVRETLISEISPIDDNESGAARPSPIIIASAFTDPHQPFDAAPTEEDVSQAIQGDEDIARSLQEAEIASQIVQGDVDIARTLQEEEDVALNPQTEDLDESGDTVFVLPPASVGIELGTSDGFDLSTPQSRTNIPEANQGESFSREVSHGSGASESNNTSSSQKSGLSSSNGNLHSVSLCGNTCVHLSFRNRIH
jgi:hypothetical protein